MRAPRPVLLILVYGAFLAIVGAAATAQSILVGAHFNSATLTGLVGSDAATVRAFVNAYVPPADLATAGNLAPSEVARLEAQLATLPRPGEILRMEIRRPDGTIVAATEPGLSGTQVPATDEFRAALTGRAQAAIGPAADAGAGSTTFGSPALLRELLPLQVGGEVRGIVGVWRDAVPIIDRLDAMRREILLVTVSAGIVAAALLFLVFRSAQARLTRQTEALLDATRRDPLTDTLNHGALVGLLAQEIERGRGDIRPIGVALIDIDNFRLLNDNHGHTAGDEALLLVASTLARHIAPGIDYGRYGPDEFLLIAPPIAVAQLEPVIDRLRTALVDLSLRFGEGERLPITVSVGIATYPDHATSATGLLAAAAGVLQEAKASGGDTVRNADADGEASSVDVSFDVLQGLVTAIDTKDRYTKRHSEDVARYAAFIGRRLELAEDELHTIVRAGRLHDIGKIGIPDAILRKPGRLTDAEYAIVQQHVALGDMIVRDLPDIEAVRAGIRHHHERWDGRGYLDHLEGESIPHIARILAVADAFSAMTTTRPYRKALDVREALLRLADAAGSQLDEHLVAVFVDGIEHDADPPLPGDAASGAIPLHPRRVA
ncbi:MAG TPA: diguanylate cyclase [Candidatus Limnocylindrales bacterium]|nr:diguanylate cyclase [Candidatus Limnocylindrales bacterium]